MAVVIRFARHGAKKKPFYRIVAADERYPRDGRFIEVLGNYHPERKEARIKNERVEYWLGQGARATPTVKNLLKKNGVGVNAAQ